jgi:hypothetical protein
VWVQKYEKWAPGNLLLSLFQLVQLPGQVLRFYSSREYEQMLMNVKIWFIRLNAKLGPKYSIGGSVLVHTNSVMARM